jgi:hypothetical protein
MRGFYCWCDKTNKDEMVGTLSTHSREMHSRLATFWSENLKEKKTQERPRHSWGKISKLILEK